MKKKPDKKDVSVRKTAAETSGKSVNEMKNAGIKKLYLKTRSACKIALRLPKEAAPDARKVNIVGDFNKWEKDATAM